MKIISIIFLVSIVGLFSCSDATTDPEDEYDIKILTYLDSESMDKSNFSINDSILVEIISEEKYVNADIRVDYIYVDENIDNFAVFLKTNSTENDNKHSVILPFLGIIAGDVKIVSTVENKGKTNKVEKLISINE